MSNSVNEIQKARTLAENLVANSAELSFISVGECFFRAEDENKFSFKTRCSVQDDRQCGPGIEVCDEVATVLLGNQWSCNTHGDCRSCIIPLYAPLTALFGLGLSILDPGEEMPVNGTEGPIESTSEAYQNILDDYVATAEEETESDGKV